jgi:biotin carboxyl carrier protein
MEEKNGHMIYVKAGAFEFRIDPAEVNSADIISTGEHAYHIIDGHASRQVHIVSASTDGKQLQLETAGETFDIQIKDPLDQMLDTMGFTTTVSRMIKEVKAPMPGLVLDIYVKEGDELEEGQRILILEAMKMENSIAMPASGKVKKVNVEKGQTVDKNQVLIELE